MIFYTIRNVLKVIYKYKYISPHHKILKFYYQYNVNIFL